jgi:amino acid permease
MIYIYYFLFGIIFYIYVWLSAEYNEVFNGDKKAKQTAARLTLLFLFWPLFFSYKLLKNIIKLLKFIFKAANIHFKKDLNAKGKE